MRGLTRFTGSAQARRDSADCPQTGPMPAGHTEHMLHKVQLIGGLPQPRKAPRVMIRTTEQQCSLFQQDAQESI